MKPLAQVLASLALLVLSASGLTVSVNDLDSFDWSSITPTTNLTYHPCYSDLIPDLSCARLKVPLDWLDTTNPSTVAIAILRVPAKVPPTDPRFGGSVLINPGGPGGSGVMLAMSMGQRLQGILEGKKSYEIIGFDPRGVSFTTPQADCYVDPLARVAAALQQRGVGELVPELWRISRRKGLSEGWGKVCGENLGVEGGLLGFSSTASIARDMVEIIDRIEDERDEVKKEIRRKEAAVGGEQKRLGSGDGQDEDEEGQRKVARLQYLGFSYGTVLGNTFASMFPGRVGRMVVDGVCDAPDYYRGTWLKNLQDTDKIIDEWYTLCFRAPSHRCPLKRPGDKSAADIQARVDGLIKSLDDNPVPLTSSSDVYFLTGADVKGLIFMALYSPLARFQATSVLVNKLIEEDYSWITDLLGSSMPNLGASCPTSNKTSPPAIIAADALPAIACADGEGDVSRNLTNAEWKDYISELQSQSRFGSAIWPEIRFMCGSWPNSPKYRFNGPFETPEADPNEVEGKPAAPLFFLSNKLDPVTPVRNAFEMSKRHPGSSVLVQDSLGHCAIGSSPSRCTEMHVRKYFEDGVVPKKGTVCLEDYHPWTASEVLEAAGVEDAGFVPPIAPAGILGGLHGRERVLARIHAEARRA